MVQHLTTMYTCMRFTSLRIVNFCDHLCVYVCAAGARSIQPLRLAHTIYIYNVRVLSYSTTDLVSRKLQICPELHLEFRKLLYQCILIISAGTSRAQFPLSIFVLRFFLSGCIFFFAPLQSYYFFFVIIICHVIRIP